MANRSNSNRSSANRQNRQSASPKSKSKGGSATASKSSAKMRITKRVVDVKRHTIGFMINNHFYTVSQARSLASNGRIAGVRVVGGHIQASVGARRLVDLPTTIRS